MLPASRGASVLWFMVYGLWFMVYGLWFMVYGLLWPKNCLHRF